MLKEDLELNKHINGKITVNNVIMFYTVAKIYTLSSDAKFGLKFIELCFPMVVETNNFLHLDINHVAKILASSELDVHSEVEVFNAAKAWLKHNSEERSKYAKQLLLKVRLSLLSEHALRFILNCDKFSESQECVKVLKTVYMSKASLYQNKSRSVYTNRYCSQNKHSVILCGGSKILARTNASVHKIDGSHLNNVRILPSLTEERFELKAVSLKGEVYVLGGRNSAEDLVNIVEKYSPSTNSWSKVTNMFDKRQYFCACAFIDSFYIFGGDHATSWIVGGTNAYEILDTNSCLEFNIKHNSWKEIASMKHETSHAACTVFQGNIVVSGGFGDNTGDHTNYVESYDAFADNWSPMPDMINCHNEHSLVVVKNKLFVIGYRSEVFDNVCKKFVALNPKHQPIITSNSSVQIGNKILVFRVKKSSVVCYDVDKDHWTEEKFELTSFLYGFSCAKLPSC